MNEKAADFAILPLSGDSLSFSLSLFDLYYVGPGWNEGRHRGTVYETNTRAGDDDDDNDDNDDQNDHDDDGIGVRVARGISLWRTRSL